jgi:hypothetical protein
MQIVADGYDPKIGFLHTYNVGRPALLLDLIEPLRPIVCQSASKFDPRSASNFDPLCRRVLAVVLAPSELVGVAETARELVGV